MIKEAYCSYEVSKLLKEKGFNEKCHSSYWGSSDNVDYTDFPLNYNDNNSSCSRPTHQMACAWLREKGVYMSIDTIISTSGNIYFNIDIYSEDSGWNHPVNLYDSYEDAVEEALKYTLENLI